MKPPRPSEQSKAARLLRRVLADIGLAPPASTLLRCKDGEPARAPNPVDDPKAYVRHVREQHALQDYTGQMLARLLSGDLTAAERERWGRGVHAFFEPFFRGQENKREGRAHGPIKRREFGKRNSIIAEWRRLEEQGTPEHDRASIIAKKLKLGPHYVRNVVAPIKAVELKRTVALRILKKSGPDRFE